MTLMEWIPGITTTGLFATIVWLSRKWMSERLSKSIQHEYDGKLAEHKASLEQQLLELKSALETSKQRIIKLQEGALNNLTAREAILYSKRVEAVEKLLETKQILSKGVLTSGVVSGIDWDYVGDNEPPKDNLKSFAASFNTVSMEDFKQNQTHLIQLYVDPLTWAYFLAYQAIIVDAIMRIHLLQSGLPITLMKDGVPKVLKKALPSFADVIDEKGVSSFNSFLPILSEKMLESCRNFLDGKDSDEATIKRAAEIIESAEEVISTQATKIPSPPSK